MGELNEKKELEISIKDLGMTFKDNNGNDVKALTGVNLDIYKGEFISLLGPSGCGKTTLLRMVADLLEPTEGQIRVCGMTPKEVRLQRKFGFVFQNAVLFDWRTIQKNIELPLETMGFKKKERRERSAKMLEMVGLTDFAKHFPNQLSGGMQQRVNIARALSIEPEILLMDEPFSALDEFTKEKLHEDLLRIWRKTNKTVLFVTHNIQEAIILGSRIVVFAKGGKIILDQENTIERPVSPASEGYTELWKQLKAALYSE